MKIIGEFVTELRVERGLSRIELARHLEVSYKTVFLLEEEELEPDKELTDKIIEFFEVTEEELTTGRKHFNDDGSRAVPRAITRKHKNAVLEYNKRFLIIGLVSAVLLIFSFILSLCLKSEAGFVISLLISLTVLFVFLKSERKAIQISNNEMLSERIKFRYYKDIIKFTSYVVCIGIGSIVLSLAFSIFNGVLIKIISVLVIIAVSAVVIYYTDRHLWGTEKISKDRSRNSFTYYNNDTNVDRELKILDEYINSEYNYEANYEDDYEDD